MSAPSEHDESLDDTHVSAETPMNKVLHSAQFIAEHSEHVKIDPEAVKSAAAKNGVKLLKAKRLADLTLETMQSIFETSTGKPFPLLEERLRAAQDLGRVVTSQFEGQFWKAVRAAGGSAARLVAWLVAHLDSFRDHGEYRGTPVFFYKRAQILVADLWAAFNGAFFGAFADIDAVTMFADYRVPQTLHALGVLVYAPALAAAMHRHELMPHGDNREHEIRGCSIWAVELILREMKSQILFDVSTAPLNAISIDFYLWDYAKSHSHEIRDSPIHYVRSVYY